MATSVKEVMDRKGGPRGFVNDLIDGMRPQLIRREVVVERNFSPFFLPNFDPEARIRLDDCSREIVEETYAIRVRIPLNLSVQEAQMQLQRFVEEFRIYLTKTLGRVIREMICRDIYTGDISIEARTRPDERRTRPEVPEGWPPNEERACVVDENGVRQAGGPQKGGSPISEPTRAWMRSRGYDPEQWQCCVCGTHNPSDPCIPGAYF